MSQNSSTDKAVAFTGEAERTMRIFVPHDGVNAMLAALGGDSFPDAADLDTIVIEIDHSHLMNN